MPALAPADPPLRSYRQLLLPLPTDRTVERILRCITGLALFGLGISCFINAELGVAPWDVLHQGLSRKTGIPIGIIIEILGVVILLLWIPLRQRLGLGTMLNAVEIGLVVFLIGDHLPRTDVLVLRVLVMLGGVLSIAVGSGFYIGAGLGPGPRDGLMLGLVMRGISVRRARTAIELVVSSGPAELSVPSVVGLPLSEARDRIALAGLVVGATAGRVVAGKPGGLVIDQRPSGGTLLSRGGRVDLIVTRKGN